MLSRRMGATGILYCIDSLQRGGTELQLAGLIARLDRTAWRPYLCTLRPSDPTLAVEACSLLELDVPRLGAPAAAAQAVRLARLLRTERVGVVQCFFQDATVFGAFAAWLARVPVRVGSFRDLGFWRDRRQEALLRRVYPRLTGFIANSDAVRTRFCRDFGLEPERVAVIPNAVDPDAFPFADHDGPPAAVALVGNLNRRVKRPDLFLQAAARIAREDRAISWHLVGDGQLRASCEALADELGIRERVVFAGRVPDVTGYLGRVAIGVNCSDSEGFSNAILEYMLRGCAVVATAVGGNREAVEDGVDGLLVPPDDPAALAGAIARLLDDPGLRRRLARTARERATARYGWERCVAAHEAYYRDALAAAGRAAGASRI
jgi:glycosyltransferase involved in cell wall biosynthesis